jgi:fructoselysine-6-P-deglycase FrlB-like protein
VSLVFIVRVDQDGDVVIALSHSGATPELLAACHHLADKGLAVFAITSAPDPVPSATGAIKGAAAAAGAAVDAAVDGDASAALAPALAAVSFVSSAVSSSSSVPASPLLKLCGGRALTYALPPDAPEPLGGAPTCSVV